MGEAKYRRHDNMTDDDEAFRERIEAVLKGAKQPDAARNILSLLFPKAESVLKTYVETSSADASGRKRSRRISESEFSPSYFGLDPQPLVWTKAEIDQIINSGDPASMLFDAQRRIELAPENERPRLRSIFLDALNGAFEGAHPFTVKWLKALVDVSPYFITNPDYEPEMFGIDNFQRLRWIIRSGFERVDPNPRFEAFADVIPQSRDLTLLCDYVRTYTPDWNPKGGTREVSGGPYFGGRDKELRRLLLDQVKSLASSKAIWSQADPGRLLWFWWSCDQEDEVKEFTSAALEDPDGLRSLFRAALSLVRSSGGNYQSVSRGWSSIVNLDDLAARAKILDDSRSSSEDRALAQVFLAALDRGRKSDFE